LWVMGAKNKVSNAMYGITWKVTHIEIDNSEVNVIKQEDKHTDIFIDDDSDDDNKENIVPTRVTHHVI
jgi:hypothetical protein